MGAFEGESGASAVVDRERRVRLCSMYVMCVAGYMMKR